MATIETALVDHLTTAPAATQAIIGTRIYPVVLPQTPSYEVLTYQITNSNIPMAHDGPLDLITDSVQFDCFGQTHAEAMALARALVSDLNGYRAAMGADGEQIAVHGVFFQNMIDHYDDEAEVWRVVVDFLVLWKE